MSWLHIQMENKLQLNSGTFAVMFIHVHCPCWWIKNKSSTHLFILVPPVTLNRRIISEPSTILYWLGLKNETNVEFHMTPECQQLCSLAHHVTGPDLIQVFFARGNTEDELGLIGVAWRAKKKNKNKKNMLKALQKTFSKSVRQMMMKRANSTASRCSAFYFIQFVQFFLLGKEKCSLQSEAHIT